MRKCYASALESCGGGMSREHPVSHDITRQMSQVLVTGPRFLRPGETKQLPDGIKSWILCKKHNSVLSDLDAEASTFYRSTSAILDPRTDPIGPLMFNGLRLERWALKMMIGIVMAKIARPAEVDAPDWTPSLHWLRILFAKDPMPASWGLFMRVPVTPPPRTVARAVEQTTIVDSTGVPIGSDLEIAGVKFRIVMADPDEWDPCEGFILRRRPSAIRLISPEGEHRLAFGWGDETYVGGEVAMLVTR